VTREIVVRRLAEAELAEASAWYELQVPGLGAQFLDQFEENVKAIAEAPLRWPIYVNDIRRYVMSRFPYVIYYQILSDKVRILRVVHTSKDPTAVRRLFE
jgi:plasmid stabilization system protein ParE